MKKHLTTLIIVALLLHSCEPPASFDKPQPHNIKSSDSFKQRLRGKYIASDQASVVTINDQLITRHFNYEVKVHKDSLDPSYQLVGAKLMNQENGTEEAVVVKGDTIIRLANWIDTLFNISSDNVLKTSKGYYFLNSRFNDHAWQVKKISLKNGVLTMGSISDEEDIPKLKEITETVSDTIAKPFSLTKRQFKKFVRQDGFSAQETFFRMKENDR